MSPTLPELDVYLRDKGNVWRWKERHPVFEWLEDSSRGKELDRVVVKVAHLPLIFSFRLFCRISCRSLLFLEWSVNEYFAHVNSNNHRVILFIFFRRETVFRWLPWRDAYSFEEGKDSPRTDWCLSRNGSSKDWSNIDSWLETHPDRLGRETGWEGGR